ncbi:MAG: M28 family peptidase [Caldisericia bacterium]|nr:M28 family peptidase [Caldisericia bacterium]
MRHRWFIFLLIFILIGFPNASRAVETEQNKDITWRTMLSLVSSNHAYQYIEALASPEMEGRQAGTDGAKKAARYIEQLFQGFGLRGFKSGDREAYTQPFPIQTYNVLSGTSLRLVSKEIDKSYQYRQDFSPLLYSSKGQASGAVIFVGYGITETSMNWDDYAQKNVKGKIVLMFRKSPDFVEFPSSSSLFITKIETAKRNGAIGVLVVDKPVEDYRFMIESKSVYAEPKEDSIPAVFINEGTANEILATSGSDIETLYHEMEKTKKPVSLDIKAGIEMKVSFSFTTEQTENVIGIIPAEDPETKEHIIICAHYDHIGKDLVNHTLFPGANDNASGTGVLIELARVFSSFYFHPKVNVVFIAFSGEEEGLLGSVHYTENPIFPLEDALCVLNMDMVGTGTGKLISGTDAKIYPDLADAIKEAAEQTEVVTSFNAGLLRSGSDHVAFAIKKVPSVFFIRSNPTDIGGYHSETDVVATISQKNLEEQIKLTMGTVWIFAEADYFILDFSDSIWANRPILHPRIALKGVGSEGVYGTINEDSFKIDETGLLKYLVNLKSGEQVIHLEVLYEERLVYEKYVHYTADPEPELICDFDFNYSVNLDDFLFLTKQWNKTANSIEKQLADVNVDSIVDEKDFALFNQSFGYTINP